MSAVELAAHGLTLSGIDYVRAIFAGELPPPPIATLMGFRGAEIELGHAVFEFEPGPQHYNPIGSVHGGVAMTLLDSAMGCAIHSMLEAGVRYTTLEVKTNFLSSATVGDVVVGVSTPVHLGRTTHVWDATVTNETTGRTMALFRNTQLILQARPS